METKIENAQAKHQSWLYCLGELILVFLPAFILLKVSSSWVGEDLIRSYTIVWLANLLMLAMIWTSLKLRGHSWKTFGLTFKPVNLKQSLRIFGQSLLVFVFAVQNAAIVELRFLFWVVEFPRSLLIFLTLLIGVVVGWFLKPKILPLWQ